MGELFVIFSFITLVILILTAGLNSLHKRQIAYKEREADRQDRQTNALGESDYKKLEERVRVLERIATENDNGLAMQIEQLRDLQDIDQLPRAEVRN